MKQSVKVFVILLFEYLVECRHQNDLLTELWHHYDVLFNGYLLESHHTML